MIRCCVFLSVLAALGFFGCSSSKAKNGDVTDASTLSDADTGNGTDDQSLDEVDFVSTGTFCGTSNETLLFHLHNSFRTENGKAELACDDDLVAVARAFSQKMCDLDFFDHTSPDGKTTEDRLNDAGIEWLQWGENLLKGNASPLAVMTTWTATEDNKATILGDFERLGLGYVECGGKHYWTALFVR
ncbi:MAG: hypothetical protein KC609_18065 [Myxococcales bacterium]|nr:hypothetical protein [Myxococcales bacterium]